MKLLFALILGCLLIAGGYYYKKGDLGGSISSDIEISGADIIVDKADIRAVLRDQGEFSGNYMLFGGTYVNHKNAVSSVLLSGLGMGDAKEIYRQYPDFHKCASPGASMAKPLVRNLNIVPENSKITSTLQKSIKEFNRNINMKDGGERVCVNLEGRAAEMKSAKIKQADMDVTDKFGMRNFLLINEAQIVNCNSLLISE